MYLSVIEALRWISAYR